MDIITLTGEDRELFISAIKHAEENDKDIHLSFGEDRRGKYVKAKIGQSMWTHGLYSETY